MRDEANIVTKYADADMDERVNILINYYPNIMQLVDGYERSLQIIIKQEREYLRNRAKGELGVRVQTSGISDPTANEAIENMTIEEAIKSGDLSAVTKDLDAETRELHELEVRTIRNMREDFGIMKSNFFYLMPDEAKLFEKYLRCGRHAEKLAYEIDVKPTALKQHMCRVRRVVFDQTVGILTRKYRFSI